MGFSILTSKEVLRWKSLRTCAVAWWKILGAAFLRVFFPEHQLTIWFIIKEFHSRICLENLETYNICYSWRVANQIRSSERYCCTAFVSSYVTQCFRILTQEVCECRTCWSPDPEEGCTGTVDICGNLPSSRTTSGTLSSSSRQALVIPLAMMAQLTIPPKILTRMASTWNRNRKVLIKMLTVNIPSSNWLNNKSN